MYVGMYVYVYSGAPKNGRGIYSGISMDPLADFQSQLPPLWVSRLRPSSCMGLLIHHSYSYWYCWYFVLLFFMISIIVHILFLIVVIHLTCGVGFRGAF